MALDQAQFVTDADLLLDTGELVDYHGAAWGSPSQVKALVGLREDVTRDGAVLMTTVLTLRKDDVAGIATDHFFGVRGRRGRVVDVDDDEHGLITVGLQVGGTA